jgi:hypothetical protein
MARSVPGVHAGDVLHLETKASEEYDFKAPGSSGEDASEVYSSVMSAYDNSTVSPRTANTRTPTKFGIPYDPAAGNEVEPQGVMSSSAKRKL